MIEYDYNYDYDYDYEEPAGYVREEEVPNLEHLRDHVQGIIEAVYESGDVMKLEFCLDEVCGELDVAIHKGEPILEKKKSNDLMQWYLGYQRATIDHLNNRR